MAAPASQVTVTKIKPDWAEIEHVRQVTEDTLRAAGMKDEVVHSVQMVSSELVENAVKYGNYKKGSSEQISHSINLTKDRITVEVKSPIKPDDETHLDRLDAQIQWIRGYQNPFEAYVEKLKEVSAADLKEGESGLGLVRIAYEGNAVLDFYIDENNTLAVSAVYDL